MAYYWDKSLSNRSFSSCFLPPFQNESWRKTFGWEISLIYKSVIAYEHFISMCNGVCTKTLFETSKRNVEKAYPLLTV